MNYIVKSYGTDLVNVSDPMPLEEAKKRAKDLREKFIADHNNGSWFEDVDVDPETESARITGEEYFQDITVLEANEKTGLAREFEAIRRRLVDADTASVCYSYELMENGVYDFLYDAKRKLDALEDAVNETLDRYKTIIRAYVENDADGTDPDYIREVLYDVCGCTDQELKEIGLSEFIQDEV